MAFCDTSELLAEAMEFAQWLGSNAIDPSPTRLGQYIRFLKGYEKNPEWDNSDKLDRLVFIVRELAELRAVHRALIRADLRCPDELLRAVLGGQALAREDGSHPIARNLLLELRIASYFAQAGYSVNLATTTDLVVSIPQGMLYVECKRCKSPREALRRAKESSAQLRRRYGRFLGRRSFGMVVLDVSQLIHVNQGLAAAEDESTLRSGLMQQLTKCSSEYDFFSAFERDKRFVSLWLQLVTPAITRERISTLFTSVHLAAATSGLRGVVFEQLKAAFELSIVD